MNRKVRNMKKHLVAMLTLAFLLVSSIFGTSTTAYADSTEETQVEITQENTTEETPDVTVKEITAEETPIATTQENTEEETPAVTAEENTAVGVTEENNTGETVTPEEYTTEEEDDPIVKGYSADEASFLRDNPEIQLDNDDESAIQAEQRALAESLLTKQGVMALQNDNPYIEKDVLLIESVSPWRTNNNDVVLRAIGVTYDKVTAEQALKTDLLKYRVVAVANDQTDSVYDAIGRLKVELESFVRNGGTMIYGICYGGWSSGTYKPFIPGDVKVIRGNSNRDKIVDNNHPIISALYSDNIALKDSELTGNFASHVYFDPTTLPANAHIILNANDAAKPTLVEYKIGKGTIIASGLTWEFSYKYPTYGVFSKKAFDDLYLYALNIAEEAIDPEPGTVTSTITLDKEAYQPTDTMKIKIVNELSSYRRNAKAILKVIDMNGKVIDTIAEIPEQLLTVGIPVTIEKEWTVGDLTAGSYKVVIEWYDQEEAVGSGEAAFMVEGYEAIVNAVTLSTEYAINTDNLTITDTISNPCISLVAKDLTVVDEIKDADNKVIWTGKNKIDELMYQKSIDLSNVVSLLEFLPGNYKVVSSVYKNDKFICSDTKTFTVEAITMDTDHFSGKIDVTVDDEKQLTTYNYSVKNITRYNIKDINLYVKTVKAGSDVSIIGEKQKTDLASNASAEYVSVNQIEDEDAWPDGDYEAILYLIDENGKEVVLDKEAYKIGKRAPRTVSSKITLDKFEYEPKEIMNITVVSELSAFKRRAKAVLTVTDENGTVMNTIVKTPEQLLIAGTPVTLENTWEVKNYMVGTYHVVVTWFYKDEIIGTDQASFVIKRDADLINDVVLSTDYAIKTDDLTITDTISNPCTNFIAKDLSVVYEIKNSSDIVVWTGKKAIAELAQGKSTVLETKLSLMDFLPDSYTVTSSVYENDELMCSDNAKFIVEAVKMNKEFFAGKIDVTVDDENQLTTYNYSIENLTRYNIKDVDLYVKTVRTLKDPSITTITKKTDIDSKRTVDFVTVNQIEDEDMWPEGDYVAVLYLIDENKEEVVLDMAEFKIDSRIPKYFLTGYSLFANEGSVKLNGYKFNIDGMIYSNDDFTYQGSILTVNNSLTTTKKIAMDGWQFNIKQQIEDADKIELPDYTAKILKNARKHNAQEIKVVDGIANIPDCDTICDTLKSEYVYDISIAHYLAADKSFSLNAEKIAIGDKEQVVLSSFSGDITLNASNIDINGLIYAPNGTVYINANQMHLTGSIIAKNIVISCTESTNAVTEK